MCQIRIRSLVRLLLVLLLIAISNSAHATGDIHRACIEEHRQQIQASIEETCYRQVMGDTPITQQNQAQIAQCVTQEINQQIGDPLLQSGCAQREAEATARQRPELQEEL